MTTAVRCGARNLPAAVLIAVLIGIFLVLAFQTTARTAAAAEDPQRFSMEFREADLRDVLRLLAQESGTNLLLGEAIKGTVTVSFKEVTLQEALDAILQSYGYSYSTVGNIVTIDAGPGSRSLSRDPFPFSTRQTPAAMPTSPNSPRG